MAVSRREVLLQGSVIGAGPIATIVPNIVALAQGQPPLRRSLGDGIAQLKQKPAGDVISWASFAAIHGTASGFNKCPTAIGTSCPDIVLFCSCMSGRCAS